MNPRAARSTLPLAACLLSGAAWADSKYNLPMSATPIAREIYDLHTLILLVCLAIFVVVFGFMFYALIKHRKSAGHAPVQFHQNLRLEILWTQIPFLILVGMAFPTTKTVLAMKDTAEPDLSIKVTGRQWLWEYEYLNEGVRYVSNLATPREQIDNGAPKGEHYLLEVDNPLVVPVGKKVRLLLTASDVIHSWWIPAFGVKQDAIPGFINEAWFRVEQPGTYRGQCAELCGVGHGFMPIVVEAKSPQDYAAWLAQQKTALAEQAVAGDKTYTLDELMAHGEKIYASRCVACHQAEGQGLPGMFPPLVAGAPFAAAEQLTKPLAERGFWKDGKIEMGSLQNHLDVVLHGIPGTAMQAFGEQLSDLDIAAVISYERNSWGNRAGDLLQPAAVAEQRKGAPS